MKKIKFYHVRMIIYIIAIIFSIFVVSGKITTSCYYYENFHIFCPTCGLTRATINFLKFNFSEAYKYHGFYTCVILPLIICLIFNDIYIAIKRIILQKKGISYIEIIFGENEEK